MLVGPEHRPADRGRGTHEPAGPGPPVILLTAGGPSAPADGQVPPLEDWVYLLVYGGFAGLGLGLLGAFAIHAWQRWGRLAPRPASGMPRRWLRPAAALAVLAALVTAVLSPQPALSRAMDVAVGVLAAGALSQLARVEGRSSRTGGRVAVVLAFVTTGAMAAWGTYQLVLRTLPNELLTSGSAGAGEVAESAVRLVAGLAGGVALAVRTQQRRRSVAVELLLHREGGPQQPDRPRPRPQHMAGGGVGQVQQRHGHGGRDRRSA